MADRAFDYLVPSELEEAVRPGRLVTVPLAGRRVRGMVVRLGASGEVNASRLRPLLGVSEQIDPGLLELAEHLAERYLAPLGACLRVVLPSHLAGTKPAARARAIQWVLPAPTLGELQLTPTQQRVLAAVPPEGARVSALVGALRVSRSVVGSLAAKGALVLEERQDWEQAGSDNELLPVLSSSGSGTTAAAAATTPKLTPEQEAVLVDLSTALASPVAERRLLWGVTGSGKTEVYLRLLEQSSAAGRGAILLVPEIALTIQAIARVRARLGERVAVLHSALPAGIRAREHARLQTGDALVAVGARSAVMAPVHDLGLIILDESHDTSYKQEDEPRYDAREVAWWRVCSRAGLFLEGTATPRLESLAAGTPVLELRSRPTGGLPSEVEVVDLRRQGGEALLAARSRAMLQETMARGEQAVVLLNRRGYASYLLCECCGEVVMCPRCEVSLTYYRREQVLRCHHCGYSSSVPAACPACHLSPLARGAAGTERLGEELAGLVPSDRVFRLDSDSVTSAGRLSRVLRDFARTLPAVLVGTQMVAKGHDYPEVTLVIVADADTGLYLPDFRAAERTFHLLTQVAGRAGRGERPGRVLLQTWNPDVACIRMAVAGEEREFYRQELDSRRRLGYPPEVELVRIVLSAPKEERARAGADYLARRLRPHLGRAELRGPARLPTLRQQARWHLVFGSGDGESLRRLLRRAVESLREPYSRRGVDLMVDVDPQSFL